MWEAVASAGESVHSFEAAFNRLNERIASAVDIPPAILFGEAPNCRCVPPDDGGFYDVLRAHQEESRRFLELDIADIQARRFDFDDDEGNVPRRRHRREASRAAAEIRREER